MPDLETPLIRFKVLARCYYIIKSGRCSGSQFHYLDPIMMNLNFTNIMTPRKRSEHLGSGSFPGTSSNPKPRPTRSTQKTASTIRQPPSGNDGVLKLQCLIESESTVFDARVPHASATVGDLKEAIQKKRELGVLKGVDPVTLELWRVGALDKVNCEAIWLTPHLDRSTLTSCSMGTRSVN